LTSLILDAEFAKRMIQRQAAWRQVVGLAVSTGISMGLIHMRGLPWGFPYRVNKACIKSGTGVDALN